MADLDLKISRGGVGLEDVEVTLSDKGSKKTDKNGKVAFDAPVGKYWLPCHIQGEGFEMGTMFLITSDNEFDIEV